MNEEEDSKRARGNSARPGLTLSEQKGGRSSLFHRSQVPCVHLSRSESRREREAGLRTHLLLTLVCF